MKTYPTNEIAIIGCHSSGSARRSCEYDLLVISRDPISEKFVKVGDSFAELIFRNEREVRQPLPELALSLASAVPLRDNSLLLLSSISECRRNFSANCAALMETRLASSLKAVGRVDELLAADETVDADFWLLSAACDYAYAELLNSEMVPAPSHLLSQIKSIPKGKRVSFKSWADASGLELASRASCENRLESLSVVYDVLRTTSASVEVLPQLGRYKDAEAFTLLEMKAGELMDSMQSVECFSYLGTETVRSVIDLYSLHASNLEMAKDYTNTIRDLAFGKDRLISEEVLRSLGLVRSSQMLRDAAVGLKTAVSALAKKI